MPKRKESATSMAAAAGPPEPPPPPHVEKRPFRYRTVCPAKLQDRLLRANTQRMYLIQQTMRSVQNDTDTIPNGTENDTSDQQQKKEMDFTVLGSTGNVYTVTLRRVPCCTCPDFLRTKDLCKHIIFILLKVIGLAPDNPLAFQKGYTSGEIIELLTLLHQRRVGGGRYLANEQVLSNYSRVMAGEGGAISSHKILPEDTNVKAVQRRASRCR